MASNGGDRSQVRRSLCDSVHALEFWSQAPAVTVRLLLFFMLDRTAWAVVRGTGKDRLGLVNWVGKLVFWLIVIFSRIIHGRHITYFCPACQVSTNLLTMLGKSTPRMSSLAKSCSIQ